MATAAFDLRDVELATRLRPTGDGRDPGSRIERDTASLLRAVLVAADGAAPMPAAPTRRTHCDARPRSSPTEIARLDADGDDPLWALADEIARLRAADPGQLELVRDLLAVLVRRAEPRSRRRGRR